MKIIRVDNVEWVGVGVGEEPRALLLPQGAAHIDPRFHGQVRLRTAQLRLSASCPAYGTRFYGLITH